MRADAQANRDRLRTVAADVIARDGADVSMRDIARKSDVGLATLLRHFPTREALLEAVLRDQFDQLTARAVEVEASYRPRDGLVLWLRDFIIGATAFQGAIASMIRAVEDPQSALHDSCMSMRASGARLLERAQAADDVRTDFDGADLFALASSLAWLGDQPGQGPRAERLFEIVVASVVAPDPKA